MKNFLSNYRIIANETSGLIALGILQSVVMAAVMRQQDLKGPEWHPQLFWTLLIASSVGMILTGISTGNTILTHPGLRKFERFILLSLFELVFIGVLLSAVITVKSL